jgi:hypothetical protein
VLRQQPKQEDKSATQEDKPATQKDKPATQEKVNVHILTKIYITLLIIDKR